VLDIYHGEGTGDCALPGYGILWTPGYLMPPSRSPGHSVPNSMELRVMAALAQSAVPGRLSGLGCGRGTGSPGPGRSHG